MPRVSVRPAVQDDAALLLAWRNDEVTRRASLSTTQVSESDHDAWLARSLDDPTRLLLVAEEDGRPVGTVRFDACQESPGVWEVSITVAPQSRGRGVAARVLRAGEEELAARVGSPVRVLARVRQDNTSSARLFEGAGYVVGSRDAGVVSMWRTVA